MVSMKNNNRFSYWLYGLRNVAKTLYNQLGFTRRMNLSNSEKPLLKFKIPRWIQIPFGLVILGFLVHSLTNNWQQVREANWHFQPVPLAIAIGCLTLYIMGHGLLWTWMVRRLNVRLSYSDGVRTYLISQLAKYIPGGVWSFAALTASGQQLGVPASLLNLIYIVSLLLVLCASALFALPILPIVFNHAMVRVDLLILLMLGGSLLVVPLLLRYFLRAIVRWRKLANTVAIERLTTFRTTLFLFLIVTLLHVLPAVSFYLFIRSLVALPFPEAIFAVMAWSGAWFIGLIILVMPSGLGVRETTLILLLQFVLPSSVATVVALGYRVFTTVLDLLLLLVLFVMLFIASRKTSIPHPDLSTPNS